ncbi:MAG: uroporphyrinogen decarboxylase family protein [Clostridia bacterium]
MTIDEQRDIDVYMTMIGKGGKKIIHREIWANPDAETYLTGIDHYDRPRDCRLRLNELYPQLSLRVPETNEPIARPALDNRCGSSANMENHTVRWNDSETGTFEHGEKYFKTEEDVFAFSPLEHCDFTDWKFVVENKDFSSEEAIYERCRKSYPIELGDKAPDMSRYGTSFYNTMFMWPLLTFGWEMFMATCLDERFERIMDEFAEINRRVFKAFSRLPVNFCHCHDDIVCTRGPVCSREWMNKYIFPRYEEYWGYQKARGIRVMFMTDGKPDVYVDDVVRCGATGLTTEPYADFKGIAKKYPDNMLCGEGDNRVLTYGTKEDIKKMVISMAETGKMCGGYFMCIGNHIAWNVPGESLKYYLDYSDTYAYR